MRGKLQEFDQGFNCRKDELIQWMNVCKKEWLGYGATRRMDSDGNEWHGLDWGWWWINPLI